MAKTFRFTPNQQNPDSADHFPMLEKTYDAKTVEPKIAKIWEEADAFRAGAGSEELSLIHI